MQQRAEDTVAIAPGVLLTITRHAALAVDGVARMGTTPGGVNRWMRRTPLSEGIRIALEDNSASVDIFILTRADVNIREVSRRVQDAVTRALTELLGMDTRIVNVHIEDVVFDTKESL